MPPAFGRWPASVCGDEEYGLDEEAHEMASGRKEIDTQTETKDAPEVDADKEVK